MFDGNHRTKRTINLSSTSSSRRSQQGRRSRKASSSSSSAASILEEAKRKREIRFWNQKRHKAVTQIQKCWRGRLTRLRFVERLLLLQIIDDNAHDSDNDDYDNAGVSENRMLGLWKSISGLLMTSIGTLIVPCSHHLKKHSIAMSISMPISMPIELSSAAPIKKNSEKILILTQYLSKLEQALTKAASLSVAAPAATLAPANTSHCHNLLLQLISRNNNHGDGRSMSTSTSTSTSTTSSNINHNFNEQLNQTRTKITLQRIAHYCLSYLQSFLALYYQQKLSSSSSSNTQQQLEQIYHHYQQLAYSILNLMKIVFNNDTILQNVIQSNMNMNMNMNMNIVETFTTTCQSYYKTLSSIKNANSNTNTTKIQFLYSATSQLMKLLCHSIPVSVPVPNCSTISTFTNASISASASTFTKNVSIKHLSVILLGIDLDYFFNDHHDDDISSSSSSSNGNSNSSNNGTLTYSNLIFNECANYFFHGSDSGISDINDISDMSSINGINSINVSNGINRKLILLLLRALDIRSRSSGGNISGTSTRTSTSTSKSISSKTPSQNDMNIDNDKEDTYDTNLLWKLMSGHEFMYIKNAFGLLEYKNRNKHGDSSHISTGTNMHCCNDERHGIVDEGDDCDYESLCFTVIQLLALLLGVTDMTPSAGKDSIGSRMTNSRSDPTTFTSMKMTNTLNTLIALVAKGDPIRTNSFSSSQSFSTKKEDFNDDNDYDGSDNEMDMDEDFSSNRPTTKSTKQKSHHAIKYRRQDLQTVAKLDQLYQSKVNHARQEVLVHLKNLNSSTFSDSSVSCKDSQTLIHVANLIGSGELILEWALVLFPSPPVKKRKIAMDKNAYKQGYVQSEAMVINNEDLDSVRDLFFSILSMTLSYCTGIKSRTCAMSPLLSKIAFQYNLMEQLWEYVKTQLEMLKHEKDQNLYSRQSIKAFNAGSSFCDLFVHQLLAMDDEEFLLMYTTKNSNGKPRSSILATELIEVLKANMHNLYWGKPVVVNDVVLPSNIRLLSNEERCHRARFLLSGTKMWNSLHQRWSRLYSTMKFCEEECWHFPRLVTREKDEEGAVFGTRMDDLPGGDLYEDENSTTSMDIDGDSQRDTTQVDDENDALASSFKDPKMARILTSIPQAIPFDRRVKLFNSLLAADLTRMQDETQDLLDIQSSMLRGEEAPQFRLQAKIHRNELYQDSMDQLNKLGHKLRKKIAVTFYNQGGTVEAGIDGGGVFREFLDDLIKEAFNPEKRHGSIGPLFSASSMQTLSVNTGLEPTQEVLSHYQFLGRVLGKAVYESLLVEPQFSNPFLNQLLGQQNTLDDLKNLDPVYYKHLSALRRMSCKDVEALGLTFELSTQRTDGSKSKTVELIPGGSKMSVTKDNAIRYIHLVAHRRLNIESAKQTNAFLRGFRDLIPAAWVRLFSPNELQKLISGDDTVKGFSVSGLKNAMLYGGGYHPSQVPIQWFWEIVEEITPDQQRKLLKFMTSCSRQPLLGFRSLTPLPCIHQVRLSEEESLLERKDVKLPTSATCMNLLKLPNYKTKELMKAKLLYAIEAGAGFELS